MTLSFSADFIAKFIRFGVVGLSGVVVDFGFTWLSKEVLRIQKFVANAIGFTIAATTNYYLNRIWTFKSHNPAIATEFTKFLIVSIVGLGLSTLVLWFLNNKIKWNFYFSKFFAIGIVMLWNFFANLLYTFATS